MKYPADFRRGFRLIPEFRSWYKNSFPVPLFIVSATSKAYSRSTRNQDYLCSSKILRVGGSSQPTNHLPTQPHIFACQGSDDSQHFRLVLSLFYVNIMSRDCVDIMKDKGLHIRIFETRFNKLKLYAQSKEKTMTQLIED